MQVKPFGFRIAKHCKYRFAKKYIKKHRPNMWERYKYFHNYTGLISDCTGLNAKILKKTPVYIGNHKQILWDLDIESQTNSCSFYHCGIDKSKSYEECQDYISNIIRAHKDNDEWGFAERYSKITLNQDGTYFYGDST
ncbi:hypothetical protein HN385_07420 [archaeon]|jgi:hypothetical protein|nr:hypothetical protein [archaeon]